MNANKHDIELVVPKTAFCTLVQYITTWSTQSFQEVKKGFFAI